MEAIGTIVRERRKSLRLTQGDLAALADTAERSVYAVEAGKATVRFDVLVKILRVLGLSLAVRDRAGRIVDSGL